MFTSRAEFRILLRQDNADLRLTPIGNSIGLADEARLAKMEEKERLTNDTHSYLKKSKPSLDQVNPWLQRKNSAEIKEKASLYQLLKRPEIGISDVREINSEIDHDLMLDPEILQQAEIQLKYSTYIDKQEQQAKKLNQLEDLRINSSFDYDRIKALSNEARQKLKRLQPETIGQASRISGVSPADVSILMVYLGR